PRKCRRFSSFSARQNGGRAAQSLFWERPPCVGADHGSWRGLSKSGHQLKYGSAVGAVIREITDLLARNRAGDHTWLAAYSSHGLNSGTPNDIKSLTLRVTSVRSLASGVAAKKP